MQYNLVVSKYGLIRAEAIEVFKDLALCLVDIYWRVCMFNPLTPELNPSAQRCLPRFFTGDFNF
jgi:hypothetical protein